jgi:drug/metabolite transporter (DMT)-like permease
MSSKHVMSSDRVRASVYLSCGVALFAIMDGLGKHLADSQSVVQIVWARYAFALPVVAFVGGASAWRLAARGGQAGLQVLRSLLPLIASVFVVLGVSRMPLGDFTAIGYASPLLVVALSSPVLGERTRPASWVGVLIGFAGVLIIARPGSSALASAAIFPLGTAFCFALYQVMTRLLSRGADPAVTFVWTIGVGLVAASLALPFAWLPVSPMAWVLLILSGLLFGVGHFLVIRAYALATASFLAPFTYVQIVAAVVMGVAVFGDVPDGWTVTGAAIVVASGIYVVLRQSRPAVPKSPVPQEGA